MTYTFELSDQTFLALALVGGGSLYVVAAACFTALLWRWKGVDQPGADDYLAGGFLGFIGLPIAVLVALLYFPFIRPYFWVVKRVAGVKRRGE